MKFPKWIRELERMSHEYGLTIHGTELKKALLFEGLLYFQKRHHIEGSPKKIRKLLAGMHKLGLSEFTSLHYELDCLKINYRSLSGFSNFESAEKTYSQLPENLRLYVLDRPGTKKTETDCLFEDERKQFYLNSFRKVTEETIKSPLYDATLKEFIVVGKSYSIDAAIELPVIPIQKELPKKGEAITVKMSALLAAASEMDQQLVNRQENFRKRMEDFQLLFYQSGNKPYQTDELTIREVCHVIGMVGAGKSTLLNVLTYYLAKENYRVAIISDTIKDVLDNGVLFDSLDVSTSVLNGAREHEERVQRVVENREMFLAPEYAPYLIGNCLLSNFLDEEAVSLSAYGKEPCFTLRKKTGGRFICPFYTICPRKQQVRNLAQANVILANVYSYMYTKTHPIKGQGQMKLFEYLIDYADLVIFDEADVLQTTLDGILNDAENIEDLLNDNLRYDMTLRSTMNNNALEVPDNDFSKLLNMALESKKIMLHQIKTNQTLLNQIPRVKYQQWFSALVLTLELKDAKFGLPSSFLEDVENYITNETQRFEETRVAFMDLVEKRRDHIKDLLNKYRIPEASIHLVEFLFSVIFLEKSLLQIQFETEKINDALEGLPESMHHGIFRKPHYSLMKWLPLSPTNNRFGFIYDEDKLNIFRQSGIGRSAMLDLPYLKLNETGEPLGPNVLLLSGSSWAKGSNLYHIDRPIQYIIQAREEVLSFIDKSKMDFVFTNVKVSGVSDKEQALIQLTDEMDMHFENAINREGRLLLIVNSYVQAEIVQEQLQKKLAVPIYRLISDNTPTERNTIARGKLNQARNTAFKILIAPATSISRGFNIVDEQGHSLFTTLFYLIRPMSKPREIKEIMSIVNGEMYHISTHYPTTPHAMTVLDRMNGMSQTANSYWNKAFKQYYSIEQQEDFMKNNITVSRLVLMMQLYGRLLRIQDMTKEAPMIYFFDQSFIATNPYSFDLLKEIKQYIEAQLQHSPDAEIVKILYGPFLTALQGGDDYV